MPNQTSLTVSATFPVSAETLYTAWLNSKEHSLMTGETAKINAKVGSSFTAWGGYITGKNIELAENKKIIQSWRSSDFTQDGPDSLLTVTFSKSAKGTKISIQHQNFPTDQKSALIDGWKQYYFAPMREYFKK